MKAVILVGGEGLRLRPLTCNLPKPMVPVANKPFLEHMIDNLKRHGVDEIILAMGYLPDRIKQYFGDGSAHGISLTYSVEDTPLGTGGAVKNAERFLDETFIVLNGDIFSDLNLADMVRLHSRRKATATIALTPVEDPTAYGVVEIDARSRVKAFIEKPSWENVTSNLINAGAYVLEPELLNLIPAGVHSMVERGLFPELVKQGALFLGYRSNAYWIDIGNPQDYIRLHHDILMGKARARFPGKSVADDIWIEEGCKIHPSVHMVGPIVMGNDCTIDQEVRITGPAVLGNRCVIGQNTVIDEAVLWHGVKLNRNVTVRRSVLGNNTVMGENTFAIDGCIVADSAVIGSNNKLERGIKVWPGSIIGDNAVSF